VCKPSQDALYRVQLWSGNLFIIFKDLLICVLFIYLFVFNAEYRLGTHLNGVPSWFFFIFILKFCFIKKLI
jgi:hypothetical protein